MSKNRLLAIPLGTFDSANLTANYQTIYADGLPHSLVYLRIINTSTVDIIISYDGVTAGDYITSDTTFILPAQQNSAPRNHVAMIAAGTMLSVKQATAAGIGNIYISGYYTAE